MGLIQWCGTLREILITFKFVIFANSGVIINIYKQ